MARIQLSGSWNCPVGGWERSVLHTGEVYLGPLRGRGARRSEARWMVRSGVRASNAGLSCAAAFALLAWPVWAADGYMPVRMGWTLPAGEASEDLRAVLIRCDAPWLQEQVPVDRLSLDDGSAEVRVPVDLPAGLWCPTWLAPDGSSPSQTSSDFIEVIDVRGGRAVARRMPLLLGLFTPWGLLLSEVHAMPPGSHASFQLGADGSPPPSWYEGPTIAWVASEAVVLSGPAPRPGDRIVAGGPGWIWPPRTVWWEQAVVPGWPVGRARKATLLLRVVRDGRRHWIRLGRLQ